MPALESLINKIQLANWKILTSWIEIINGSRIRRIRLKRRDKKLRYNKNESAPSNLKFRLKMKTAEANLTREVFLLQAKRNCRSLKLGQEAYHSLKKEPPLKGLKMKKIKEMITRAKMQSFLSKTFRVINRVIVIMQQRRMITHNLLNLKVWWIQTLNLSRNRDNTAFQESLTNRRLMWWSMDLLKAKGKFVILT